MSTRFGINVEKEILNEEIGCVLLCKSVPVLKALPHVTISSTISLTIARWTLSLQR